MKSRCTVPLLAAILVGAMTVAANAHTGIGDTSGLAHGFLHPVSGPDHILAMVAVGLFAAQLGGRAIWLVPLSFVAVMAFGGVLGLAGVTLPFVELGIGLSVLVLGAAVAFRLRAAVPVAMGLVGFFAVFHGYAHGAEMPENIGGFTYGVGFMLGTAMLHAIGVGAGLAVGRSQNGRGELFVRSAGALIAITGAAFLGGLA
ncbi:HupE/UreJ family protein [Labrys sp. ZIDIC5]|uniref:HupE/UreJ family protein n=1 Tax=Labrys sedimenti TaxID=3106036 RepID=UPI002ACA21AF|nr:HupE/UreJ family protein [Labrys sp. ZIDIC5]MDZ5453476.1 HupE/UreJ family protein [Labrys sp. ZIDIC5]